MKIIFLRITLVEWALVCYVENNDMNNRWREKTREMVMLVAVLMECEAKKKNFEKFSTLLKTRNELKHSLKTFSLAKQIWTVRLECTFASSTLACLIRIVTDLNGLPYYTFKDSTLFRCWSQFLFENLLRSFFFIFYFFFVVFIHSLSLLTLALLAIYCFINIYILWYVSHWT